METLEILGPALATGLILALIHPPLGIEVLKRGIVFIDLALAQIAALGLLGAQVFWPQAGWLELQGFALAAALLAAGAFRWVAARLPGEQEPIIGATFIVAASVPYLLLSGDAHAHDSISRLLAGQILFVTWSDLLRFLPVFAGIALLWCLCGKRRGGIMFYLLFAVAIVMSVQLAGVFVVFASLILPAIAVNRLPDGAGKTVRAVACAALSPAPRCPSWPAGSCPT